MFFLTRAGVLRALGCADLPPRVDDLLGAIGVDWGGGIWGILRVFCFWSLDSG